MPIYNPYPGLHSAVVVAAKGETLKVIPNRPVFAYILAAAFEVLQKAVDGDVGLDEDLLRRDVLLPRPELVHAPAVREDGDTLPPGPTLKPRAKNRHGTLPAFATIILGFIQRPSGPVVIPRHRLFILT